MPTPAPPATQPKPRVLLIGWDAADWMVLNPLIDAGRMPNLARLVEHGVMGNLASLQPCLSPMLWTSIATGKTADAHGILGFVEPRADGLGVVPSRSTSRRAKALWRILDESGQRSCVVAWPVSDPVEPISGVYVSERFTDSLARTPGAMGPAPEGCVHPASLHPFISELRLHPCELAPEDLLHLVPEIGAIDLKEDPRPGQLADLLARCASVHAVATAAMEAEEWEFFGVYYDMIDRAGHDFMCYRAPRQAHISSRDFALYGQVMDAVYEFHDAMLGRLLELAGSEATVVLVSDHGFESGVRRPVQQGGLGLVPAEGADWHRMLGVIAMRGPGLREDERIYGATLLDIAPTVLHLLGLPVGRDMAGRVLSDALRERPEVSYIDSWEATGAVAAAVAAEPLDLEAAQSSVRQLAALGYLCADAVEGAEAAVSAEREARFNLAAVHLHHGRAGEALALLESVCLEAPLQRRYELARLSALSRLARHDEIAGEVERLESAGLLTAHGHLVAAGAAAAQGRLAEALARLESAAGMEPGNPAVHQVTGDFHLARGRLAEARQSYERAIGLDPGDAAAQSGLAQVHLELGEWEAAAEHGLASIQEVFFNPQAQFRVGQAMAALGRRAEARRAYEHAIEQAPGFGEARYRLAAMLDEDGDPLEAAVQRSRMFGGGAERQRP